VADYQLERLANLPAALLTTQEAYFSSGKAVQEAEDEARAMLDAEKSPIFLIADYRTSPVSFEELMKAAESSARGDTAVLHHPMLRQLLVVTNDDMLALGAEGLRNKVYGNINVSVFNAVDDAIAYVESQ